jgi:dipeptidyl aminopeptidase/acylaminoacyl peptidase
VFRVPADGKGDAAAITPHRLPALATRLPQFLPDGRHYLFYVARGGEPAGVYVGELGSETIRKLLDNDWPATYARGHLWFVRDGWLLAQPFDPGTQQLSGQGIRVTDDVGGALFASAFSVSTMGQVAFRPATSASRRLRWFDRSGKELGVVGEEGNNMSNLSLSRDDRLVVVQRTDQENIDLWSLDLVRKGDFERLTVNPAIDSMPILSPDSTRLAFNTLNTISLKRLDGSAADERLTTPSAAIKISCDWSPDGKFLLYKEIDQSGTTDLWALPMEGERTPLAVAQTAYDEREGQFSPDGKSVAYDSDESGRRSIYVQPFPGSTGKHLVSTGGGSQARWRRDGQELFYIAPDGFLMAVPMGDAAGPSGIGTPVRLFKTRLAPFSVISRQQYAVSRDGKRFLMIAGDDVPTPPISLILNWKPPTQH